jgi:hypothetical protein
MNRFWTVPLLCVLAAPLLAATPAPLPDHPGNVFLAGERVTVTLPVLDLATWRVTDYAGAVAAEGKTTSGRADVGPLPVGWYELSWGEGRRVAIGVLEPLKAPTPRTSPIGVDVAMAWFYKEPQMPAVANLCALAGMNWVRDRLTWAEMEPRRGEFAAGPNKYDASARIQSAAGLRVLQVIHLSPPWANPDIKRFPPDLRDGRRFYEAMARRWAGQVAAFEPWNEADIPMFGGHTGSEMASLQKAAYLGLKAGDPAIIACLNVFALPSKSILADLADNQSWPYFDTFNLHHYAKTDDYPGIYAAFRAVSGGRPLWSTEFSMPVKWAGDENLKEPTDTDLRVQAERVAQVFAAALHEGPQAAFYFLFPHYSEGPTQFGIVRPDLTPRPAYVALAAAGRLLADARPLGQLKGAAPNVRAFIFRARPDGVEREVLVAWAADGKAELALPAAPAAVFDHLGRPATGSAATGSAATGSGALSVKAPDPLHPPAATALTLTPAPTFALLAPGTAAKMSLDPPPAAAPRLPGEPSPVVLQALWPKERIDLGRSAYRVSREAAETVSIYVYNFSDKPVEGELAAAAPSPVKAHIERSVKVPPQGRVEVPLTVDARGMAADATETVRLTGDFGAAGKAVLSLRVTPQPPPKKDAK